jgi:hypothetical protein
MPGGPLTTVDRPGRMVAVTGRSPAPSPPRPASVLERITYVNEDTSFTIARVATDRTGPDLLTVVGPLLGAQIGESLRLTGHWSSHPKYGRQFEVTGSVALCDPRAAPVRDLDALRSDCQCEVVEDLPELVVVVDVGGDVVVAAAHILHEGMTGGEDPY